MQAERYAGVRAQRVKKVLELSFEQRLCSSVDREQPELSFDMDALNDRILVAETSRRQDQHDAVAVLKKVHCSHMRFIYDSYMISIFICAYEGHMKDI